MPHGLQARSPKGADAILAARKDTPIPLPPEAWPMLVTCDDIARPQDCPASDPDARHG